MSKGIVITNVDERGVAEVILNRPERNNAYNGEMISELIKSFTALNEDQDVRVVLLRGNGKHFQGGADLEWLKEIGKLDQEENIEVSKRTASAIKGLIEFPKPTIAMIHGGCFGGGTGIAAAADIVIASEDATTFVKKYPTSSTNTNTCQTTRTTKCVAHRETKF